MATGLQLKRLVVLEWGPIKGLLDSSYGMFAAILQEMMVKKSLATTRIKASSINAESATAVATDTAKIAANEVR